MDSELICASASALPEPELMDSSFIGVYVPVDIWRSATARIDALAHSHIGLDLLARLCRDRTAGLEAIVVRDVVLGVQSSKAMF